jgi:hypothetical protein
MDKISSEETDKEDVEHTHKLMRALGEGLDEATQIIWRRRIGFTLLTFDFNKPEIANYISNAKREDMIIGLRKTADRLESNMDKVYKGDD